MSFLHMHLHCPSSTFKYYAFGIESQSSGYYSVPQKNQDAKFFCTLLELKIPEHSKKKDMHICIEDIIINQ